MVSVYVFVCVRNENTLLHYILEVFFFSFPTKIVLMIYFPKLQQTNSLKLIKLVLNCQGAPEGQSLFGCYLAFCAFVLHNPRRRFSTVVELRGFGVEVHAGMEGSSEVMFLQNIVCSCLALSELRVLFASAEDLGIMLGLYEEILNNSKIQPPNENKLLSRTSSSSQSTGNVPFPMRNPLVYHM